MTSEETVEERAAAVILSSNLRVGNKVSKLAKSHVLDVREATEPHISHLPPPKQAFLMLQTIFCIVLSNFKKIEL